MKETIYIFVSLLVIIDNGAKLMQKDINFKEISAFGTRFFKGINTIFNDEGDI